MRLNKPEADTVRIVMSPEADAVRIVMPLEAVSE